MRRTVGSISMTGKEMPKPKCRDCGSEDVAWGTGKNGKAVLYDTKRPHWIGCKKRRKVEKSDPLLALQGLGYKAGEAKEMLAQVPAKIMKSGDVQSIVTAALKGAE